MHNQSDFSQQRFWGLFSKKLANEATESELQELHSILLNNPDLHHQSDLISEMWDQGAKPNLHTNEAAYMRHMMKHKDEFFTEESNESIAPIAVNEETEDEKPSGFRSLISPKESWRTKRLSIVSFIALIIISTGTVYFLTGSKKNVVAAAAEKSISVVTKNGNRTRIVLPDGSQVWLNAGSNLDYNNSSFNKELREVSLNGEAYFDVTKNEAKPFIIHTKKMDIKVVGTAFNVRSYNDEKTAEASLIRGTIEVTLKDRKDKITLKPYDKIQVNYTESSEILLKSNKKIVVKENPNPVSTYSVDYLKPNPATNIIPEIAWTQNKLSIQDKSFEEIGPILEKWFGIKVIIESESLKKKSYTGTFEKETIVQVLEYWKFSRAFNYKIVSDTVVIY